MKISISPYKLKPVGNWNLVSSPHPCEGCLIKVEFEDGRTGYADFHPWPSLGDLPMQDQLDRLKRGQMSLQLEQSIWMANRDSQARIAKVNALEKKPRIKNHFFLSEGYESTPELIEEIKTQGFSTIKMKVGNNPKKEADFLNTYGTIYDFNWRLDANAKLDRFQFANFWNLLDGDVRNRIEYVEDPVPYKLADWQELSKFVPLALDREYDKYDWSQKQKPPFKVVIIKPAVQEPDVVFANCVQQDLKVVVSTYLDHPIAAIHANWVATDLYSQDPYRILQCGLLSQRAYSYSDFVSLIELEGSSIKGAHGTGIGFDILWERLPWTILKE